MKLIKYKQLSACNKTCSKCQYLQIKHAANAGQD